MVFVTDLLYVTNERLVTNTMESVLVCNAVVDGHVLVLLAAEILLCHLSYTLY